MDTRAERIKTSNRCRRLLRSNPNARCYLCQNEDNLHVHHLNWHHSDDSPSNLLIVCKRCHAKLHKVGYLTKQELEVIASKVARATPGVTPLGGYTGQSQGGVIPALALTPKLNKNLEAGEASYLTGR